MYYVLLILAFYGVCNNKCYSFTNNKIYTILMYLILVITSAFRYNTGTDFSTYTSMILYYKSGIEVSWVNYEPGFIFLNLILSKLTESGQLLIIVSSFLTLSLFFYSFIRFSDNIGASIFLFVSLYFYSVSFNLVRQFIAISIALISIEFLKKQDIKKYIVCVSIASLFHSTAIVFFLFYFFPKIKWDFSKFIIGSIFTLIAYLSYDSFAPLLFNIFPKYSIYKESIGGGSVYNIVLLLICLIMLAYVKINSLYDEEDKEMLNVYFSSTIIALFVTVFSIKLVFFARASYNFMVISLFSIPFCWKKIKGKDLLIFKWGIIIFSIVLYIHNVSNNVGGVVPYQLWNFEKI